MSFLGGMDAVTLIKTGFTSHSLKYKGDQADLIFGGQVGINFPEFPRVFYPHVGWYLHAGKNDLCGGIFPFYFINDRLQIFPCLRDRNTSEPIISSQLEDKNREGLVQDPVDPAVAARGGLSAYTGVDDFNPRDAESIFAWINAGKACEGSRP